MLDTSDAADRRVCSCVILRRMEMRQKCGETEAAYQMGEAAKKGRLLSKLSFTSPGWVKGHKGTV